MAFLFRMYTPGDIDALIDFWGEHSGWGPIPRPIWEHQFLNTPLGPAVFALAIDQETQNIAGQFGFIPSIISVDGEQVNAYRPVATIVREDLREGGSINVLQDVILRMYEIATQTLAAQGAKLIHFVPDPRWVRVLKLSPAFRLARFSLYVHPLPVEGEYHLPPGYAVEPISFQDPRITPLWEEARKLHRCMIVRDNRALDWKNSHALFRLTGVIFQSKLVGLFTSIVRDKGRKHHICDVLTTDSGLSLKATLTAAIRLLNDHWAASPEEQRIPGRIELLVTPLMEEAVKELGFQYVNFPITFAVHILDPALEEAARPENWYLSTND